jgi:translation initiation factor IF-2
MSKMRVYEYAKKHNVSSKELITKLKDMNIEVSNHMTMIEDDTVKKLDEQYAKGGNGEKKEAPKQTSEQKPAAVQVQSKTKASAFDEDDDRNVAPAKVKVKTGPKAIQGKKGAQKTNQKKQKLLMVKRGKTTNKEAVFNTSRSHHSHLKRKNYLQKSLLLNRLQLPS